MAKENRKGSSPIFWIGLLVGLFAVAYWMDLFEIGSKDYGEGMLFKDSHSDLALEDERAESLIDSKPAPRPFRTEAAAINQAELQTGLIFGKSNQPHRVKIRVLDDYDQPLADALIVPWIGDELSAGKQGNRDGVVVFEKLSGSGGLVIAAPGWYPQFVEQNFAASEITVRILTRAQIAGRVEFFGSRQEKTPFGIQVFPVPNLEVGSFPASLMDGLEAEGINPLGVAINVHHDLSFQLKGIPAKWSGRLKVPHGVLVKSFQGPGQIKEGLPNFIELIRPDDNLFLQLIKSPSFYGRVVTPDGAKGVAGAPLTAMFHLSGNHTPSVGSMTNEGGHFEVAMPVDWSELVEQTPAELESMEPVPLTVWLEAHGDWAGNELQFGLLDQADPWNLGDLPLQAMNKQPIMVLDEFGKPLEGALAYTESLSELTNAVGETVAWLREGDQVIAVAAAGYQTQTQRVDPANDGVMRFILDSAVQLTVKWPLPEDGNPKAMKFRILSEGQVFAAEHLNRRWKLRRALGEPLIVAGSFGNPGKVQPSWVSYRPKPEQADFQLTGLATNQRMRIQMIGRLGSLLAESEPMIFSPGEQREITLPKLSELASFTCRVLDPAGQPIPFAKVDYSVADPKNTAAGTAVTGSDGEFRLDGIGEIVLHLTASAGFYKDRSLKYIRVYAGCPPLEITLQPKVP